ncbi:MAG: trypsin-like peptidase domain-containing protein [Bacteroidota bacterium]
MSLTSFAQHALLAVALLIVGCDREAHSQQPPQEADAPLAIGAGALEQIEGEIASSRRTAITRAVEAASPAVVSVNVIEVRNVRVRDPFAGFDALFGRRARPDRIYQQEVQAVGSGFIISPDGYIVTNDHVAGNATKITIAFADGTQLPATLIGSDPETDIALLKVDPEASLPFLAFEESGDPIVGEWAIALGNPFGLFEAADPSVTVGVVSAVGRDFPMQGGRTFRDMIQTDAAINSGNSGGPLVDALGRVIGMNTFIYSRSGGSVGLGFAVPSWRIQRVVAELQTDGEVDRDFYTGFDVRPVTPRIAQALGMPEARGLIVASVEDRSPAASAGLEPYDIIVRIEDEPVPDVSDVRSYVRDRLIDNRIGDTIRLGVVRDGTTLDLDLTLQAAG